MIDDRVDPEEILKKINLENSTSGKLKIYLGMAAGSGKTYTMLSDAIEAKKKGIDIVCGYIEPHGRVETENLAFSLENIPNKIIRHRELVLNELDLELSLERKPKIILVDELAHSNPAGMIHEKRWQDIEDILRNGIDVWTTLNIQHVESLNDLVLDITKVQMQETVPDSFLARADQIEVVDITPEQLIARLDEGKIYSKEKILNAKNNFFQLNNLFALREILLRHTADSVSIRLRSENLHAQTSERKVIVCVAPSKFALRLVRAAARLSHSLHGELIAVSIHNSQTVKLSEKTRSLASKALKLAQDLGGSVVERHSENVIDELINVANEKGANVIVVGKSIRAKWKNIFSRSLVDELIKKSSNKDVYVVTGSVELKSAEHNSKELSFTFRYSQILSGFLFPTLVSIFGFFVSDYIADSNLAMVYILGVTASAVLQGRIQAISASIVSVLAFDFFFVKPKLTFAVSDSEYLITFLVMLVISFLISSLTAKLKWHAEVLSEREKKTSSLFEVSKALSSTREYAEIANLVQEFIRTTFNVSSAVIEKKGSQLHAYGDFTFTEHNKAILNWCIDQNEIAGKSTNNLPASDSIYIPLLNTRSLSYILCVNFKAQDVSFAQKEMLEIFQSVISLSLNRIKSEKDFRDSLILTEQEKAKNIILSSVSHDLRTPLTVISGNSEVLLKDLELKDLNRELIENISVQAKNLNLMITNILELVKYDLSNIQTRLDWCSLEEIVFTAYSSLESLLEGKVVKWNLKEISDLKLDAILIEKVFVILIDNFIKYTPKNSTAQISANVENETIVIKFSDDGYGVNPGEEELIFERLQRGGSQGIAGTGLGLAIVKSIIQAHHGEVYARNISPHGLEIIIKLPFVRNA